MLKRRKNGTFAISPRKLASAARAPSGTTRRSARSWLITLPGSWLAWLRLKIARRAEGAAQRRSEALDPDDRERVAKIILGFAVPSGRRT